MPLSENEKGAYNIDLQNAVKYLYAQKIISKDKHIADKLNVGAGTVSNYVNGKSIASASFRKSFEKAFAINLTDFKPIQEPVPRQEKPGIDYRAKYIEKLEETEAFLKRLVESNLIGISDRQEGGFAIVIELLKRDALREAKGNQERADEILADILRRIGPDLSQKMKEGIAADGRS